MNRYQATRCVVCGDIEFNYDYPPSGTVKVWAEVDDQLWTCDPETGVWTADGVADSLQLEWEQLLEEIGAVYDTPPGVMA